MAADGVVLQRLVWEKGGHVGQESPLRKRAAELREVALRRRATPNPLDPAPQARFPQRTGQRLAGLADIPELVRRQQLRRVAAMPSGVHHPLGADPGFGEADAARTAPVLPLRIGGVAVFGNFGKHLLDRGPPPLAGLPPGRRSRRSQ